MDQLPNPQMPSSPNPLASASRIMLQTPQPTGVRPTNFFIGNDVTKSPTPPQPDSSGGGKYFCTALRAKGLLSNRDYLRFANAHALALLTHGDFAFWYAKNAKALVEKAENARFDWSKVKALAVDRTIEIYEREGFKAALRNYMQFTQAMFRLYGQRDFTIEPFRDEFYYSGTWTKAKGTLKLLFTRAFWSLIRSGIRIRFRTPILTSSRKEAA